jgi:hypothetical protein
MGIIFEKAFVDINGVRQGMIIKIIDVTYPVLLNLHGGMPEYFLTQRYPTGLEDYFAVVWWERGSGLSYNACDPRDRIILDQLISDALEVTKYLHHRFHKGKIFLMAQSGRSLIGIQTVAQALELYHAYIGMAQMSNQLLSDCRAYEYML